MTKIDRSGIVRSFPRLLDLTTVRPNLDLVVYDSALVADIALADYGTLRS
jgi:hypothetical protein